MIFFVMVGFEVSVVLVLILDVFDFVVVFGMGFVEIVDILSNILSGF